MVNKFKRFEYQKDDAFYVIDEDIVGWYLITYNNKKTSEDYLYGSLQEAFLEAQERFNIPKEYWKEIS